MDGLFGFFGGFVSGGGIAVVNWWLHRGANVAEQEKNEAEAANDWADTASQAWRRLKELETDMAALQAQIRQRDQVIVQQQIEIAELRAEVRTLKAQLEARGA